MKPHSTHCDVKPHSTHCDVKPHSTHCDMKPHSTHCDIGDKLCVIRQVVQGRHIEADRWFPTRPTMYVVTTGAQTGDQRAGGVEGGAGVTVT